MRRGVLVFVLTACGRIAFDPLGSSSDADPRLDGEAIACAPRTGQLRFHSTLDDLAALQTPAIGSPTCVTAFVSDFVPGRCGNALRIDAPGEVFSIDQIDAGSTHFDFTRGAVELWYQPLYDTADGQEHRLFGCTDFSGAGGILIRKASAANGNQLQVTVRDSSGAVLAVTAVAADAVPFSAGTWVHVAVSWDFAVASGQQNVRVHFDGVEPAYASTTTGPLAMRAASSSEELFVGGYDVDDPGSALGLYDEVIIHADPR